MKIIGAIKNKFFLDNLVLLFFVLSVLLFALRGIPGNPSAHDLLSPVWQENGPFELSPERGRFAIVYSLLENKSFYFALDIAKFAVPDLGYKNGHYVSLFAPAISFIVMPGYVVGKMLGASQVGAYFVIAIFAAINALLVRAIATALGAKRYAGTIASIVFLFGTPAFAYAVNLYQHHISTLLILLSVYILISWDGLLAAALIWFLCAMSIPVDYPNLFLMAPIGIAALGKIFSVEKVKEVIKVKFKFIYILSFLSILAPLAFFAWFNYNSYSNPLQFSGTVPSVDAIGNNGKPAIGENTNQKVRDADLDPEKQNKSAIKFFEPRNILNGFYIHLVSPDRGTIYYAPIVIFGIFGGILALSKKAKWTSMLLAIAAVDLVLYSMWGDPWGGWAFGSRYLIPAYAILSIFIAHLLTYWRRNKLFILIFSGVAIYSVAVNTLGAITTSMIPPQVQVLELEKISHKVELYTFQKNWQYLLSGHTKSFIYRTFLESYLTPLQFYILLSGLVIGALGGVLLVFGLEQKPVQNRKLSQAVRTIISK